MKATMMTKTEIAAFKTGYKYGWNEALEIAILMTLAFDSNRGNEKPIAKLIDETKVGK